MEFVHGCIDSVEQMQVLLRLHGEPARVFTAAELTRDLRSTESSILRRVEDLYQRGVLARPENAGELKFGPPSPKVAEIIEMLAKAYRERPTRVIELIYSRPPQALQAFSDAFKFRKDEDK